MCTLLCASLNADEYSFGTFHMFGVYIFQIMNIFIAYKELHTRGDVKSSRLFRSTFMGFAKFENFATISM